MGFADEVNNTFRGTTSAQPVAKASEPAAEPTEAVNATEPPAVDVMNEGLAIPATLSEASPVQNDEKPASVVKETPKVEVPIKIGTQTFTSVEEAMKYANELELAVLQTEAFEAGKREATAPKEQPAEVRTIEDEIADQLFDDPKAALLKYKDAIKDEVKKQIVTEARQEKTRQETWNNFYTSNADLAANTEVVDYVLQKNWNKLGSMPANVALEELATMTRAFLGSARETQLPTKELSSKKVTQPSGSATPASAPVATEKKALDFITQVNKHRKRDAALKA